MCHWLTFRAEYKDTDELLPNSPDPVTWESGIPGETENCTCVLGQDKMYELSETDARRLKLKLADALWPYLAKTSYGKVVIYVE